MKDSPGPRSRLTGALMVLAALVTVTVYLLVPSGSRLQALTSEALVVATGLLAGGSIALATARGAWKGSIWLAWGLLLMAAIAAAFFALDILDRGRYGPRAGDLAALVILLPLLGLATAEYRRHVAKTERRELVTDALLLAVSVGVVAYIAIRPPGADAPTSISAAIFACLAAVQVTAFGALVAWAPRRVHVVQWLVFMVLGAATLAFGWEWTRGTFDGTTPWTDLAFALCPLAFGAMVAWMPLHDPAPSAGTRRWGPPVLTSLAVAAACGALILVATVEEHTGMDRVQASIVIAILGLGVAARIVANQIASTQAQRQVRAALAEKEQALHEADQALESVRETNETLTGSEEHLQLVFDTAVDGVVELDERGVVLHANESFCRMVSMDRAAIEGQPWSALGAAVTGADAAFADLARAGEAEIRRPDGQPLYLESRVSKIPMTPPRTLMLVRDVTAGRVADQTIRSLFQFLQDRDEDRSRLLRRSNAAIESERNRIARDLHDGPVQGVSAASLSLEAALLMIKAGEVDRGIEVMGRVREELTLEADALRRLMSGLRPPVLEERGLVPALQEMVMRFGDEQHVHTEFASRVATSLPEDLETLAYRVVQEALSNAAKHAGASMLTVSVDQGDGQLRIEVQDDGEGFDGTQIREFLREGRVGLASMRERVELASGTFVVRSSPGRGVTIVATLPFAEDSDQVLVVTDVP